MSTRRSRRRKLPHESLCLEDEPGTHADTRKDQQLCGQIAEALSFALAECGDPRLAELFVEAVEPAPNASRVRVVVSGEAGLFAPGTLRALERARGHLRRQIAADIHRKRVPELCFELTPPMVGPNH